MHIDMIDEADKDIAHPTGMSEQAVVEPFVYSPVPTTLPNPHSHAPSNSVISQANPPSSVEPPSSASASAPSAPVSSSSGNNNRSEGGDSSLRSQVQILMTQLADVRAQQALQQHGSGEGVREEP